LRQEELILKERRLEEWEKSLRYQPDIKTPQSPPQRLGTPSPRLTPTKVDSKYYEENATKIVEDKFNDVSNLELIYVNSIALFRS
jgi:hypothetical protein